MNFMFFVFFIHLTKIILLCISPNDHTQLSYFFFLMQFKILLRIFKLLPEHHIL